MQRQHSFFSRVSTCTLLMVVWLCAIFPATSVAQTAASAEQQLQLRLDNFLLDTLDDKLELRFGVSISDLEALKQILRDGAVVNLTSSASLSPKSTIIPRGALVEIEGLSSLQMDPLTREFILSEPDRDIPNRNKSLKQLLDSTWLNMSLPLCNLSKLSHDSEYVVDLAIKLEHADVPPWLTKTLFFWSWDVTPPINYSMTFTF
ncbi:DUF4390 domain-containing protein [Oleidesulfovibrio sp.]|uniref:DUF4390 domain-containing protein n=1 Tax=Oleidesulfovibrio sp. TaxID=2909707 RepID=UPI003A87631E